MVTFERIVIPAFGILMVSLITIFVIGTAQFPEGYGTVVASKEYNGSGNIQGFAHGTTGQLQWRDLTIAYNGETKNIQLPCNAYKIGDSYPIVTSPLGGWYPANPNSNIVTILPGCQT